jgi:hypothetical protein
METTLATMEDEPFYELFPVGLRATGKAFARRFYTHYFSSFLPRMVTVEGARPPRRWQLDEGVLVETDMGLRADDGSVEVFAVAALILVGDTGVVGERVYADERLLQAMFGPAYDELDPIRAASV